MYCNDGIKISSHFKDILIKSNVFSIFLKNLIFCICKVLATLLKMVEEHNQKVNQRESKNYYLRSSTELQQNEKSRKACGQEEKKSKVLEKKKSALDSGKFRSKVKYILALVNEMITCRPS